MAAFFLSNVFFSAFRLSLCGPLYQSSDTTIGTWGSTIAALGAIRSTTTFLGSFGLGTSIQFGRRSSQRFEAMKRMSLRASPVCSSW
ncbi:hypothetical protein B0T16DRAFT_415407 [Cercophora newfieldiana]|uniref:Secreted protein n=1 Tax=Cercophora newfieldiana TaxID=92897 RepID=A0AA39XZK4_9PEZI|nr:hypothetical protein B0T16DRAFT_415407 [Cercophora newfieldiana]